MNDLNRIARAAELTQQQLDAETDACSPAYYQVGVANDPQPEDELCTTELDAIDKAQRMADCEYNRPIAVWSPDRAEIIHLFLCGQQFRST